MTISRRIRAIPLAETRPIRPRADSSRGKAGREGGRSRWGPSARVRDNEISRDVRRTRFHSGRGRVTRRGRWQPARARESERRSLVCHGPRGTPSGRRPARPAADSLPLRASKQERGTYSHERARTHARTRFAASHVRTTELPNYRHYLGILRKDPLLLKPELSKGERERCGSSDEITYRVKDATYSSARNPRLSDWSAEQQLRVVPGSRGHFRYTFPSLLLGIAVGESMLIRRRGVHHKVRRTHNRDTPRYSATWLDSPEITPGANTLAYFSTNLGALSGSTRLFGTWRVNKRAVTSRAA